MTGIEANSPPLDPERMATGAQFRENAIRGSAWMVSLRWLVRFIGLANTAILARLLTPRDFGIYAMAMLVVGIIAIFGETGQSLALVRIGKSDRAYLDTAWTIQLIIYSGLAVIALLFAPLAGLYFQSREVQFLIWFISLRIFAQGFVNIGVVLFRIELNYSKDFRYNLYQKFIGFAVTVACAISFRNYWALATAVVVFKILHVGLSFAMHPFRPRLSLCKTTEIWSFSFWMLLVYVSEYVADRVSQFIVASFGTATDTGRYNVSSEVATTPTVDVVQPITYALFPVYARLLSDRRRLQEAVRLVLGATATICFATGPGTACIAREFTLVFLGPQWKEAAPLLFWLALGGIPAGLNYCIYSVLSVTDNARLTSVSLWIRIAVLIPVLCFAMQWGTVISVAILQPLVGSIVLFVDFYMLRRAIGIRVADIMSCLYRPVAAALIMAGTLFLLEGSLDLSTALEMFVKIGLGAMIYTTVLAALWWLAGEPDGIERLLLVAARRLLGKSVSHVRVFFGSDI